MSHLFLKILNMSISASYVVLVVLLLRLLFKKAPKWIAVILWGIVALRLVCPVSIESVLSLIPRAEVVSPDIMLDRTPEINTGIPIINEVINPVIGNSFAPDPLTSANPLQLWIPTLALIWLLGVVSMLAYALISYARLRRRVSTAVRLREELYQSENVTSPFVLGIFKPRIYLPFCMEEKAMAYVIAHERSHVRRLDHWWKPLGFLLLAVHWFNPLMWVGYLLLCRDIELACDERVIGTLDRDARADYSEALLACSVNRRLISACPLAFGEVGVKARIKSVLHYKKPAFWIVVAAVAVCVAVAVCFLTNPKNIGTDGETSDPSQETEDYGDGTTQPTADRYGETDPMRLSEKQIALMQSYPAYFGLNAARGLDVYVWQVSEYRYAFILLQRFEGSDRVSTSELMKMDSIGAEEMREILSTYDVDPQEVEVYRWQNPLSSTNHWIWDPNEDIETQRKAFGDRIRAILFD